MTKGYQDDPTWRETQKFLPEPNQLTNQNLPDEYYLNIHGMNIHIDHYRHENPKARLILFHGVGGNGRLLSFIALPLQRNGFEVLCPDLPLYGYSEYSGKITYETWVDCATEIIKHYQDQDVLKTFLFGLSAGGLLAYQAACKSGRIAGVLVTCILDQRNMEVTKRTAKSPLVATIGKPFMRRIGGIFDGIKLPLKMIVNMKAITNNEKLAKLLMKDKKSSGVKAPISFIRTMMTPEITVEPEQFISAPFLLVHPGDDRWTDISLSRYFFDKLVCEKELKLLEGAGHFPIESPGLEQLEVYCLAFLHRNL